MEISQLLSEIIKNANKNATSATTCSGKLNERPENFPDYSAKFVGGVENDSIFYARFDLKTAAMLQ